MRVFRLFAIVVLCLALGGAQVSASQARREPAARDVKPSDFSFPDILGLVGNLLTGVWSKVGCGIDPWGHCKTDASSTDAGCQIDPLGGCADSTPAADTGCTIDPLGCPNQ